MNRVLQTREAWLERLTALLRPLFSDAGFNLPADIRVSCSWPSNGATATRRRVLGQAFASSCSAAGAHETFISPALDEPARVAEVLVHELVHHAVGIRAGHGSAFRRCALAIGLVGPMRSTSMGEILRERVNALLEKLEEYPHAKVSVTTSRKQSTRMLKLQCPSCGCLVRMTRRWLKSVGPPRCGCGAADLMQASAIAPAAHRESRAMR